MKELRFVVLLVGLSMVAAGFWNVCVWTNATGGPISSSVTCPHCGKPASWIDGRRYHCYQCFMPGDLPAAAW